MESKTLLVATVLCFASLIDSSASQNVTAVFVFGDSSMDVGTNNFLPGCRVRADFPHYGVDFPQSKPTGRFSNGFNSADFIAMQLGFNESPPPFLAIVNNTRAYDNSTFKGANFASGGSGVLLVTGQLQPKLGQFVNINLPSIIGVDQKQFVSFPEQIKQFSTLSSKLVAVNGPDTVKTFLSKSFFVISIGSNDIVLYFLSKSAVARDRFIASLIAVYEKQLTDLYNLGARKVAIIAVPPLGCTPALRNKDTGACTQEINNIALDFQAALKDLLVKLTSTFKDMKFSVGNVFEMTMNVIQNPSPVGLKDVQSACCGTGKLNAEANCNQNATICSNRDEFLFWDFYHDTQAATKLFTLTLFSGEQRFVSPINFNQLAEA